MIRITWSAANLAILFAPARDVEDAAIDRHVRGVRYGRVLQIRRRFVDTRSAMLSNPLDRDRNDDPRLLRQLLGRAHNLASRHALHSVVVGLAGFEGDPDYSEVVDYLVSSLRVDDGVYRMTRERTLLLLTDVDCARAREIIDRVIEDYRESFPRTTDPALSIGYYEVVPGSEDVTVKQVLPTIFADPPRAH